MKIKTGYHAIYEENYFNGIDDAKKYGFEFVQFDLGVPAYFLNEFTKEKLLEIKKYAEDSGIEVTFHSPADNIGLFSDYPLIRKGILDEFKAMLEKANIIGARHMTFHTGVYSKFKKSGEKEQPFYAEHYEKVLYENLKTLINASGDVLVCVENDSLDDVSRRVIQRLIDEKERLYLTLDTAKMYVSDGEMYDDDYRFFQNNKARIREIHIHDKNDRFGSHQTVGEGYVDFFRFDYFFNEDTYLNFEVRPVEEAKRSKDNLFEKTEKYYMKFMFDWCSGTCLWSTNAKANRRYGYPVDISKLPVSEELKNELEHLASWHDKALNWAEPNSDLLWTEEQTEEFLLAAKAAYQKVCLELGSDYVITLTEGL